MRPEEDLVRGEIAVEGRIVDACNATLFGSIRTSDEAFPIVYKPKIGRAHV